MRRSGHANPAGGHHNKLAALELLCVVRKHAVEMVNLGLQGRTGQPKEDDSGVAHVLMENKLAEILVSDNKNAPFLPGNCEDVLIGKTMGILARDCDNIMAKGTKVGNQAKVSTLVEQEVHRLASERTPLGGLGETSCPFRISLA